jgi:phosphopantetheine--protein transferase-like protein
MKSAGNDIVALEMVNKQRTNQSRFYSKIISASEQELYHQPEIEKISFENYLWLLWSVKESVYKYLKRGIPDLVFSPTKIIIQDIAIPKVLTVEPRDIQYDGSEPDEDFYRGKVIYHSNTLYFRAKISDAWIASVVNDDENFEAICWGVREIDDPGYKQQSQAVRAALVNKLSGYFPGDLRVEKSEVGYPVIINDEKEIPVLASLAHDGCFVAYSFVLDPENICS